MGWQTRLRNAWGQLPLIMQLALGASTAVAVALVVLAFAGPEDMRGLFVVGLFGLFVVVQVVILWYLAQQNASFRRARRAFVQGEFDQVIRLLEAERQAGEIDILSQTLLGNAYRQQGQLAQSEAILRAAHEARPQAPFPAYGLGRTLMVKGDYAGAEALIQLALANRGQPTIAADLGHVQYRAGKTAEALQTLNSAAELSLEPYRALLTSYLLWQLEGADPASDLRGEISRLGYGLEYWQVEANRFAATAYGAALADDLSRIEQLIEEAKG